MKSSDCRLIYIGVAFFWLVFPGCTTTIVDVIEAPVESYSGNTLSLQQVGNAILQAGRSKEWVMEETAPGEIIGVFNPGRYTVKVGIPYTTKTYSILYKDSKGLKANEGKIHRKYNSIVKNLKNAIFNGITLAHQTKTPPQSPLQQPPPATIEVQDPPKQEDPAKDDFADWLRQQVEQEEGEGGTQSPSSAYSE